MIYVVCNNNFTTKSNVVVSYSLKLTFQIVIFYISDSRPLADFVFKLFFNYLCYSAVKNRHQEFFMTNSSRNNCDAIKQWKTLKESVHTVFII